MAAVRHLEFVVYVFGPYLMMLITVQNFVRIDAALSIIGKF